MTFCNNFNDTTSNSNSNKLGHQFLIESKDDKTYGGEDVDITNQELLQLITKNNNLDTSCIDDRINGRKNEAKFSDVVKIRKNFMTFDEEKLNGYNRDKFIENCMYNGDCEFEAKYPARIKAVDRGRKSIVMTKSTYGSSFKKKS